MKKDKAFTLAETLSRHSERTNVTEESMMCHCDKSTVSEAIAELYGRGYRLREEVAEQPTWQSKENKILDCFTFVRNDKKCKCAFTLAETLIVLVILGVIAAITIPALVNRHMEAERRTKLKKAMTVYDTALNKMVIENGIKSDTALTNWADSNTKNDCTNTSAYFKVARNLEVNGNTTNCKFRAADGVFWDISDIKKPLVALREQDLNAETAQSDTNRAFYMFGWFDENGSLRANDLGKISATDKAALEKLYDFILNNKTKEPETLTKTLNERIQEELENFNDYLSITCSSTIKTACSSQGNGCCEEGYWDKENYDCYSTGDFSDGCKEGYTPVGPEHNTYVYDSKGNLIFDGDSLKVDDKIICSRGSNWTGTCDVMYEYDDNGNQTMTLTNPVNNIEDYNNGGTISIAYTSCEGSGCDSLEKVQTNCSMNYDTWNLECDTYYIPTKTINMPYN